MALFGIKIKPLKIIGKVIQFAGPAVLTVAGGPVAGAVSVAVSAATGGSKKAGQALEAVGFGRPHKVGSPLVNTGTSAGLPALLQAFGVEGGGLNQLSETLATLGLEAVPPWLAIVIVLWFSHKLGNDVENAGNR